MAILLQFALGGFPPFFPIIANDVRDQDLLNLIHRSFSAVTVEDEFDKFEMVGGRHLTEIFEIGSFAGENVVFGDGLERFCRECQVHGMAWLVGEIDGESGENGVDSFDAAKSPASMHAKAASGQLHQRLNMVALQLACGGHFLEFFSHTVSYRSLPYKGMLY
jgi:hypothetical protein